MLIMGIRDLWFMVYSSDVRSEIAVHRGTIQVQQVQPGAPVIFTTFGLKQIVLLLITI